MLQNKGTYQDVVQKTGVSTATISRINRSLQYGAEGYHLVVSREPKRKRSAFLF